ncbi:hypothetical protein SAMN02746098_01627 [Desulfosporosinus lacus DSM 15449]|uniref:Uncharacterized protein n=1 Tax=Desulfosporosinus lacus DSM 15449 TaxID=1121420 RepID=A0A1M5WHW9_9FIRM|nr:hypothetical protein SAMN02746098_01627 [Desulfosporosinus lacus DSM 15449]
MDCFNASGDGVETGVETGKKASKGMGVRIYRDVSTISTVSTTFPFSKGLLSLTHQLNTYPFYIVTLFF